MDVSSVIDNLNDAQRQAVAASPSHLLVLAGAGSGKTRVLVHRIAWLMQVEGASPYSIMAVTFTNKAAHEMRARIEQMLGQPMNQMWVGTFHGLAHRLLRQHWQAANLPQHFQILDSEDQFRLIRRIMRGFEIDEDKWPPRQAQWYINQQKDNGLRPANIKAEGDLFTEVMLRIYTAYEEQCRQSGMVDFAELLLRSYEVLLKNADILQHYRQRFAHVLVDEFQDTNTIQYLWLKLFVGDTAYMMVVGDDDQSIYSWRGAKIENIHRFNKEFNATTVRLEQNYRSTKTILQAANAIITNNSNRMGKELWTEGNEGELIDSYCAFNEIDEARYMVSRIQAWQQTGGALNDSAILYRSNAQSRVIEEALLQAGVPYRIYGGLRFFERAEIKDILAYLRLTANPNDDAAFERVVNVPTRGIGNTTVNTVREEARQQKISLWQAAKHICQHTILSARACNALGAFTQLIENLIQKTQDLKLAEQSDIVLSQSGLLAHFQKDRSEKGLSRVENLEEFISATREYEKDPDDEMNELDSFLSHVALEAGDHQAQQYSDCVQLMTLHAAKGLEFPLVFLCGLEEGLFPHQMCLQDPVQLEEERRLCYVGMTRAMEKLVITYTESRRMHGKESYRQPSRFIAEIPAEFLQDIRLTSKVSRPMTATNLGKTRLKGEAGDTGFQLGQRVSHAKFGEGTVLNYEGEGAHARVQVKFEQFGTKWLVVAMANLNSN